MNDQVKDFGLDPMYRLRLHRYQRYVRGPRGRIRLWRALIKTFYRLLGWSKPTMTIVHDPLSRPPLIGRGTRPE